METTRTLDSINDSRQTEPGKYVWGKFTPDTEGTGFQDLPEVSILKATDTVAVDNGGATLCQCTVANLASSLFLSADTQTVSDWNSLTSLSGYKYIHTTAGTTLNSPVDVTADWFVEFVKHSESGHIMLTATRCDNPRARYIRTYYSGAWSAWVFAYGHYAE